MMSAKRTFDRRSIDARCDERCNDRSLHVVISAAATVRYCIGNMLLPRRVLRSVILLVLQLTCVGAFTTGSDKQHRSFVSSRSSLSSPQSQQQLQLQRDTSSLQSSISGINNAEGFYTDDEWHPHDPAYTTPQLLSGIWGQIARGTTMVKGVSSLFRPVPYQCIVDR
jgi:hypothetical protein